MIVFKGLHTPTKRDTYYYDYIDYDKSTKKCNTGHVAPLTAFSRNKMGADGFQAKCKECQKVYYTEWQERQAHLPSVEEKTCPGCMEDLPSDAFAKNRRYSDGLQTYCKTCFSNRYDHQYWKDYYHNYTKNGIRKTTQKRRPPLTQKPKSDTIKE